MNTTLLGNQHFSRLSCTCFHFVTYIPDRAVVHYRAESTSLYSTDSELVTLKSLASPPPPPPAKETIGGASDC